MGDCGCDKAKKDLEEYLHNELCSEEAADIHEHLKNCVDCSDEHNVGIVLTHAVQRACDEVAPDQLRSSISANLKRISMVHNKGL